MTPRGNIPPHGGVSRREREGESELQKLNKGLGGLLGSLFGSVGAVAGGQTIDARKQVRTGDISVTGTNGITNIAAVDTLIHQIESQGASNVAKDLEHIKGEVLKNQELSLQHKQEAMENVETVAREATKTKPNKNVMESALERVKDILGTATTLTSLVPTMQKLIEQISKFSS
jgi:hypothetical protein